MMFCTGCGMPIQPEELFCHHCGKQLYRVDVNSPPHRKKTAPWVLATGILFLLLFFYYTWSTLSYANLEEPVRAQLESIRQGRMPQAYYEYTSKQFQKATTLEDFRRFVTSYSVLQDNKAATFESPFIEDSKGFLKGMLYSTQGDRALVQYILERQDDEWKIFSLKINNISDAPQKTVVPAAQQQLQKPMQNAMRAPVEAQLAKLKAKEIKTAYEDNVSQEFKKITSYTTFEAFIKRFPIFTDYSTVDYQELQHEDSGWKLIVMLHNAAGGSATVEYTLGQEGDKWLIWGFKLLSYSSDGKNEEVKRVQLVAPKENKGENLSYFQKIVIGNEVDANGAVIDEKSVFTDPMKSIVANVYVNGKKGDVITVVFKHIESNSAIAPVKSSPLTKDGIHRASFSFSPPPKGWPKGHFTLEIVSSGGDKAHYEFDVK